MLRGHIDLLKSSGSFAGWAYDTASPEDPLEVAILDSEGREVAHGLAHCYREDLVAAKCGIGWCAFCLRTEGSITRLRRSPARLIARRTNQILFSVDQPDYVEDTHLPITSIQQHAGLDPTVITSVEQLAGCGLIFDKYIRTKGVDAFVRVGYIYTLGRSADIEGLMLYGRLIRQSILSPYIMIRTLAESTEFLSRPRQLAAPNMPEFPFRLR